jgi:hypothetical protein
VPSQRRIHLTFFSISKFVSDDLAFGCDFVAFSDVTPILHFRAPICPQCGDIALFLTLMNGDGIAFC